MSSPQKLVVFSPIRITPDGRAMPRVVPRPGPVTRSVSKAVLEEEDKDDAPVLEEDSDVEEIDAEAAQVAAELGFINAPLSPSADDEDSDYEDEFVSSQSRRRRRIQRGDNSHRKVRRIDPESDGEEEKEEDEATMSPPSSSSSSSSSSRIPPPAAVAAPAAPEPEPVVAAPAAPEPAVAAPAPAPPVAPVEDKVDDDDEDIFDFESDEQEADVTFFLEGAPLPRYIENQDPLPDDPAERRVRVLEDWDFATSWEIVSHRFDGVVPHRVMHATLMRVYVNVKKRIDRLTRCYNGVRAVLHARAQGSLDLDAATVGVHRRLYDDLQAELDEFDKEHIRLKFNFLEDLVFFENELSELHTYLLNLQEDGEIADD